MITNEAPAADYTQYYIALLETRGHYKPFSDIILKIILILIITVLTSDIS